MDNITFFERICSELWGLSQLLNFLLYSLYSPLSLLLTGGWWEPTADRNNNTAKTRSTNTHINIHTHYQHIHKYTHIYTSKRQSYLSYQMYNGHTYIHVNIFSYILKLARAQQRWAQKTLNYPDEKAWGTMKFVELSTKLCVETKCGMIREKSAPIGAWKCNFPSF